MSFDPELKKHLERQVLLGGHQAQAAIEVLNKYSPDQPRDDHGRFSSTGASDGGSGNMKEGEGADFKGPKLFLAAGKKPLKYEGESNMSLHNHLVADGKGGWKPDAFAQKVCDDAIAKYTAGVPSQDNPRAVMMGGGPAAGKSSMISAVPGGDIPAEDDPNYVHINADDIKADVPGYKEALARGDQDAASNAHEMSSWVSKEVNSQAMANSQNIVLDGTGNSDEAKLLGKIESYQNAGYTVDGRYVTCPTDDAIGRMVARGSQPLETGGGRYVPEGILRETHSSVSQVVPNVADNFDTFKLYDSSGPMGTTAPLIAEATRGNEPTIYDQALYDQFLAKGNEDTSTRTWINMPQITTNEAGVTSVKFAR
jgi:predicted ABC-type ATPase